MFKIVNKKRYDTTTADCLGKYQYSTCNDLNYTYEALYRTKGGEYFLYAEGGPFSGYRKAIGQNAYIGDETIIPMSYSEAQQWVEAKLSGEDYERIFGEVDEDDTKNLVSLMISAEAAEKLARYAGQSGKKESEIVEKLLMALEV